MQATTPVVAVPVVAVPVVAVVVTWNSSRHLETFFASLAAGMAGIPTWRTVVVDNASSDGTPEAVRRLWPDATVVQTGRNAGYAAGINAGLVGASSEETLVVLNPDVQLQPGCVRRLVETAVEPTTGIAFPTLTGPGGGVSPSIRREPRILHALAESLLGGRLAARLGLSETVTSPEAYRHRRHVDWASGAVLAVSPSCRAAVGGWDESYFLYSEEVDYCRRARRAGFSPTFVPDAVAHHTSGEYGTNIELWRVLVRNRVRYFARHHSAVESALFRLAVLLGQLLRAPFSAAHRAGVRASLDRQDPGPDTGLTPPSEPVPERPREAGFIWFAAQDWWYHNQAHSDFQLMKEVSREQTVLLVNSLGLRMPHGGNTTHAARRITRKVRSTAKFLRRPLPELPGYHVMTPVILPFYGEGIAARLSAWLIRLQVRLVARSLGIGHQATIGVTIPTAWPVVSRMRHGRLIFNRADLHSSFPEADTDRIAALEHELLSHSDWVLYVSHELMEADSPVVGERAFFIDHGVDLEHFAPGRHEHPDVARLPRPRVGFFGGFDDYVVDMELLLRTAEELPEAHVVLVGDATCSMQDLLARPNVTWLGHRPYDEIPALGTGFDVAIMPWLENDWIRHANPIKLKEYLALGLPVVTTYYPEVEAYREDLVVADVRDEFPALVRKTLGDPGDPVARRTRVQQYSWSARARALVDLTAAPGPR